MNWIQNSVFEADLTKAELRKIKEYVSEVIGNGDSVVIYEMGNEKYVNKDVIGEEKGSSSQIL